MLKELNDYLLEGEIDPEKMREEDYLSWIKEFLNGRRLFLEKALRRQKEVRS